MDQERFVGSYPPYDPTDLAGFSYETVLKRWPIILTNLIDNVHSVNHHLHMSFLANALGMTLDVNDVNEETNDPSNWTGEKEKETEEKITEGNDIISAAAKVKYEMARDKEMYPIEEDGEPSIDIYNRELAELKKKGLASWFKAPWLFAECYLYRIIRTWFARTKHWSSYDPFFKQKQESFRSSGDAVYQLARTLQTLDEEKEVLDHDEEKLEVLWEEMIQMCLWGNATDLSLLTSLSASDIQSLQSHSLHSKEEEDSDAQSKRKEFVLRDDTKLSWEWLRNSSGARRVDVILDNAGFELFTDLLFADFLVSHTQLVDKVVFHPKTIPWFVSDVIPSDVNALLDALASPSFFNFTSQPESEAEPAATDADVAPSTEKVGEVEEVGNEEDKDKDDHENGEENEVRNEREEDGAGEDGEEEGKPHGVEDDQTPMIEGERENDAVEAEGEKTEGEVHTSSPAPPAESEQDKRHRILSTLSSKWRKLFDEGTFVLSIDRTYRLGASSSTPPESRAGAKAGLDKASYWSTPYPYWNMHLDAPQLLDELRGSSLMVFKGDLNYRKLTGDIAYPPTTPFPTSLGPLFSQVPILSLRTNKADVCVGLDEEVVREVEMKDKRWRVNGKYAIISFAPASISEPSTGDM